MFSLPLLYHQQPPRSKSNNSSPRKRKRKGSRTPDRPKSRAGQITGSFSASLGSASISRHSALSAVLTPDEIYQHAVAGQPVEDERRSYPFPHAGTNNRDGPSKFDYDVRQQLRPFHDHPPGRIGVTGPRSLHQQHLAVMTTILHRSLLEEDFVRAGRALGMILRDETGGKPIDVRAEGRWGIGAEILTRQDVQRQHKSLEQSSSSSTVQTRLPERPKAWYTRKGFEDAKKYYERLIVQYPFYKHHPDAASALDFYPAMFGLWIYVVHQEAHHQPLESKSSESESDTDDDLRHGSNSPTMRRPLGHQSTVKELLQAREIADRMDLVMSAVPYREDIDLIELKRMVQRWVLDLEEVLTTANY